MGRSMDEAKEFREIYFSKLKGSKEFIDTVAKKVQTRGYVFNKYDRRYFIPMSKSYVGVNYLVQGTTGDLVKDRMNSVFEYLYDMKSKILNQIHDELVIEIHESEEKEVVHEVVRLLEYNPIGIPLKVDVAKCIPSWAHKIDVEL
jgi:DNA polymerase-1